MSDAHAEHKNHSAVYAKVLGALLVLTVLTVLASSKAGVVDFGAWSFGVAMLIATAKALLVALIFMHLKYENPLTWLYAIFPIALLALLIGLLFLDNPYRPHHGGLLVPKPAEQAASEHH